MRPTLTKLASLLLLILLAACQAASPVRSELLFRTLPTATQTYQPTNTPTFQPINTPTPQLTNTPTAQYTNTPTYQHTNTPTSLPPSFHVRFHPDDGLYVGDQVSFEVIAPAGLDLNNKTVQVQLPGPAGSAPVDPQSFASFGLGGRQQATFLWAWDTTDLQPGTYDLTFSLLPTGPVWTETVTLLPAKQNPFAAAQWMMAESQCCQIYYITGSAAERDIKSLKQMADQQAQNVAKILGTEQKDKIPIVLLPRVLGHGGFTSQEIAVSYLDRNYAGSSPEIVLHHEIVHWLDNNLGGELRPSLLVEGLAVYLTGGHFKPEPLMPRAAALLPRQAGCSQPPASDGLDLTPQPTKTPNPPPTGVLYLSCGLNQYIPLEQLADDFYPSQHEIGYLQAGALIEFMVETWGWPAFINFYRDIHPLQDNPAQSAALDQALQKHFDVALPQLEERFLKALGEIELTPGLVDDVRLSVGFYDTVRRYQRLLDSSAYFLTVWLPGSLEMRQREIVADYLRHPDQAENLAVETILVAADNALRGGNYARAAKLLAAINALLDVMEGLS